MHVYVHSCVRVCVCVCMCVCVCVCVLRKLRSFNVSTGLLQMFYTSTVSSVLTFGSLCWGGNAAKQDKDRLEIKSSKGEKGQHVENKKVSTQFTTNN